MPKREYYNNGDAIALTNTGCDGCTPSVINGVLCHEAGCPEAWRDRANPRSRRDEFDGQDH
jgi:hypothetical protein